MMTLDRYLDTAGAKTLSALAIEIGVSKGRLSQLRNLMEWPPELALKVEEATDNALNASELSAVVARAREATPPPAKPEPKTQDVAA